MWSGKVKQEEEGQVAKKTQLEDLAIPPWQPRDPGFPHFISFPSWWKKLTSFLRSSRV